MASSLKTNGIFPGDPIVFASASKPKRTWAKTRMLMRSDGTPIVAQCYTTLTAFFELNRRCSHLGGSLPIECCLFTEPSVLSIARAPNFQHSMGMDTEKM
ncbi:hypothetical protein COOONC_03168 [Cooperia oncophora]